MCQPILTISNRIDELIKNDRYLTPKEKEERQAIEDAKTELVEDVIEDEVSEESIPEEVAEDVADEKEADLGTESLQTQGGEQSEIETDSVAPVEEEIAEKPAFEWQVGKTVYLDGTAFDITEIRDNEIQLLDPTLVYPIFRVESRENFERLINADERNFKQPEDKNVIPAVNFQITDDHLGEGGPKQKYVRNIEAIRLLYTLEEEKRNATPEEQEVLSQYVGWGGLADAFDKNKSAWSKEYEELKNLLPEREYEMARASTLNAHYTSPVVIRAMYDAMAQMGFTSGNILEPAMGIGNFFGMMPEEMRNSRLYGVELDSISGRIAKKLYPNADITVAGFETTDRRDFFDVAIGNVPFGNYKVSDKSYDKLGFSIHNYFFAKALDQVRPGGVVAFVTSRYTMDQQSPDVRKYLAQRAELLGAIRLPNNAFKADRATMMLVTM